MAKLILEINDELSSKSDISVALKSFSVEHCRPDKKLEDKVGSDYCVHFVTGGEGILTVEDSEPVLLKEGMAFLIYPGLHYCYRPVRFNPWTYVWFSFGGENFEEIAEKCGFSRKRPYISIDSYEEVKTILKNTVDEYERTKVELINTWAGLLHILSFLISTHNKHSSKKATSSMDKKAKMLIIYIFCNYALPLDNDSVAKANYISTSYMMSIFTNIIGMSFRNFLNAYRVSEACMLLRKTDNPISEISTSVGFLDPKYFARVFKEIKGMSPREYRSSDTNEDPFKWLEDNGIDYH